MENKSKVLFIGDGQAGGNVVEIMSKKEYDCMAFNTASSDLEKLTLKERHKIGDTEGAGKNLELSKKVFSENLDLIREKIKSYIKLSEKKLAFIVTSTGGGTGRGSVFVIANIVKELGIKPVLVTISPFDNEGGFTKINDLTFFSEFESKKNEMTCICFENQVSDKVSSTEQINNYIADCFDNLLQIGINSEPNFDFMDMFNALRPGYAILDGSKGTNVKLVSKRLDVTKSKYASLIKIASSKEDGYKLMETLGLGVLDRSYYPIIAKDNPGWLLLSTGMGLNKETAKSSQETAINIAQQMKKQEQSVNIDTSSLGNLF